LQNATWVFEAKIVAENAAAFSRFGYSICLEDSILVVGSPHYGDLGQTSKGPHSGAAYIFELSSSGDWNQAQQLIPDDLSKGYNFGHSVDCAQNYIAIGAFNSAGNSTHNAGAVYIYTKANGTWILDGEEVTSPDGKNGDRFGYSISLNLSDKLYLLVGAYQHNHLKGAAYLYEKNISSTSFSKEIPIQKIKPNTLSRTKSEQYTVNKVEEKRLQIKGSQESNDWVQIHKFQPSELNNGDIFGYSVSIDEDNLVIGSPMAHGIAEQSGAAYYYRQEADATWSLKDKLINLSGKKHDQYGIHVEIASSNIFIGSTHHDGHEVDHGKIYSYRYINNEKHEKNHISSLHQR
ncbi:uncharacterized protein METZ01_LOCUS263193, partial [marine metagenome]